MFIKLINHNVLIYLKNYKVSTFNMTDEQSELYGLAKEEILLSDNAFTLNDMTIYRLFQLFRELQVKDIIILKNNVNYSIFSVIRTIIQESKHYCIALKNLKMKKLLFGLNFPRKLKILKLF